MRKILIALIATVTLQSNDLHEGMEALERGDFESAVVFFERSAQAGNKLAQQNLSVMYSNGYGVKKDKQIASKWLKRATNHSVVAIR